MPMAHSLVLFFPFLLVQRGGKRSRAGARRSAAPNRRTSTPSSAPSIDAPPINQFSTLQTPFLFSRISFPFSVPSIIRCEPPNPANARKRGHELAGSRLIPQQRSSSFRQFVTHPTESLVKRIPGSFCFSFHFLVLLCTPKPEGCRAGRQI